MRHATERATMRSRISVARVVLLGVLGLLLIALWKWDPRRRPDDTPEADESALPLPAAGNRAAPPPAAPSERTPVAESCDPHTSRSCSGGDLWWFDGCGEREELAESCAGRGCQGASCLANTRPDP